MILKRMVRPRKADLPPIFSLWPPLLLAKKSLSLEQGGTWTSMVSFSQCVTRAGGPTFLATPPWNPENARPEALGRQVL